MVLGPMALLSYYHLKKKDEINATAECYDASRAEKIRGNYENKIRFFSPPEKSFEIFASEKTDDGELRMSYRDFLHAMTPFSYTTYFEGGDEYLKEHRPEILK